MSNFYFADGPDTVRIETLSLFRPSNSVHDGSGNLQLTSSFLLNNNVELSGSPVQCLASVLEFHGGFFFHVLFTLLT